MDEAAWRVVVACVAGVAHVETGTACQDAQHCSLLPGGLLLAVVADGAGSALHPDIGAQSAVASAAQFVTVHAAELQVDDAARYAVLKGAFESARDAVERAAAQRGVSSRELASTLILATAGADWVATGQVGDGAVVVQDDAGVLAALTVPQCGEAVNETSFLVSPNLIEVAQFSVWHGRPEYLALFSDGLQRLALRGDSTPHAPFFAPLFQFLRAAAGDADRELAEFVTSPPVIEKTDDDVTLVLARYTAPRSA